MMAERVEQRVLAALRLRDRVSRQTLNRPLRLVAPGVRSVRNLSGLTVITAAPGLDVYVEDYLRRYTDDFVPPPGEPAPRSVALVLTIEDPRGSYLPRRLRLLLPRDPDPDHAQQSDSLFQPLEVDLYPAASAPLRGNRSALRVSLTRGGEALRGALLRVVRVDDDALLGSGIVDARGEGLVIVPGIPVTRFDATDDEDAPVMVAATPVRVEISLAADGVWPVDPDQLEAEHAANLQHTAELSLSSGQTAVLRLDLPASP